MAISNPVALATAVLPGTTNSTISLTTTATVPSSSKVWVIVTWFHSTITLSGVSGGGGTYTIDHQSANGLCHVAIVQADFASGLASGSTITATFNASGALDQGLAAYYSTGVTSGSGAAYGAIGGSNNNSTTWDSGAVTVSSGDILIGASHWEDSASGSSTPGGGNTELEDKTTGAGSAFTTTYQIGTGAAIHAQGTWSPKSGTSNGTRSAAVAYSAAAGGSTKAISGTVNATSDLSGALVRIRQIAGTINATSALSGAVGRIRLIAGTFNATSALSGSVARIRQIAGTINATSALSGALSFFGQTRNITGTANATSSLSGTLVALRAIAGSFSITSSLSGSLVAQRVIKGTINATSTLAGAVSIVGQTATQFISNHFPIIQMFQKKR